MGVDSRIGLSEPITLEHVEESCFPGIIESKKDNIGVFLEEAEPVEDPFEEVDDEHFSESGM